MAKGRHARSRSLRVAVVALTVLGVVLVAAGGAAYSAFRYERARADRILPGITIDGVDVGGLTRAEAERAVSEHAASILARPLTVTVGDASWRFEPGELGHRAQVDAAVDQALAVGSEMATLDRFWHRFREHPVAADIELTYATRGPGIDRAVAAIADDLYVPARDAAMAIDDSSSDVTFIRSRPGARLVRVKAANVIRSAIVQSDDAVRLDLVRVEPEVTERSLGPTIVVRVDRNELQLFDGFEVVKTWDVATAKPGWTTPTGLWKIWDKRENPAWYNPALDSWGADLPAVVPGGPGNPMGTRAIYIDAPGLIRIHGTTDPDSVGRYASHGCIRMRNEEVEALFERIPVGTHVIVVGHRPAGAAYWDTPGTADI